jgi:hypothetical protein
LIRDPAAYPTPGTIRPEFLIAGLAANGAVRMGEAGALAAIPPAWVLARSASTSYRVAQWQRGPQILAAVGPLGAGKVVALADASWLTDERSLDGSAANWELTGHAALALALVRF